MDEGILEVSELAGDRVVELRVVDELRVGLITCKRGEIVKGDEGPVSGVAQVVCHGVKVVGVHREEGQEKEGEVQGEVKGEVEQLRDNRTCAWREDGMTDSRNLSQVECDVSVRLTRQPKQRAGVLRPRACWCTSCHCCHCPHWSSRCCTCGQVVLRSHFVRELLYQEMFSFQNHYEEPLVKPEGA